MNTTAMLPQLGQPGAKSMPGEEGLHTTSVPGEVQNFWELGEERSVKQFFPSTLENFSPGKGVPEPGVVGTQVQESAISPRALIVKFSTRHPGGRINSIERRGPQLKRTESVPNVEPDLPTTVVRPILSTPTGQKGKKKGRPFGSKNKNRESRGSATTADKKEFSRKVSEGMRASWARRRQNMMAAKAPTQVRNYQSPSQHAAIHSERQLFKGQRAIRSTSGPKYPPSVTRPVRNAVYPQQSPADGRLIFRFKETPRMLVKSPCTPGGPLLDDPPGTCKDDIGLIVIFRAIVYPHLLTVLNSHRKVLAFEELKAISKQVADETISENFRIYVRENKYELDLRQCKLIKKHVQGMFNKKVHEVEARSQTTPVFNSSLPSPSMRLDTVAGSNQDRNSHKHDRVWVSGKVDQLANNSGLSVCLDEKKITERADAATEGNGARASSPPIQDQSAGATSKAKDTGNAYTKMEDVRGAIKKESNNHPSLATRSEASPSTVAIYDKQSSSTASKHLGSEESFTHQYFGDSVQPEQSEGTGSDDEENRKCKDSRQKQPGLSLLRQRRGRPQTLVPDADVNETLSEDIQWRSILHPSSLQRQHPPARNRGAFYHEQPYRLHNPTAFDPELEATLANAALSKVHGDLPYKSAKRGHYDFFRDECLSLLKAIDRADHKPMQNYEGDTPELHRLIRARLGPVSEDRLTFIVVHAAYTHERTCFKRRKRKSLRAFLIDLTLEDIPPILSPKLAKPKKKLRDRAPSRISKASSLLRSRELGYADRAMIEESLSLRAAEGIRPWRSWKGASGDVVTCAWAPDGLSFATGAAAQSDNNDLQYNRPRNLLFGQLAPNTISELPDHRIERPKPESIASGPNSMYAVYQACDPVVYKTVTSVQFSPGGDVLYTASHDKTAKLWNLSSTSRRPSCLATLLHDAEVTSLEVSNYYPGVFATASKTINNSIRVYQPEEPGLLDRYQTTGFSSSRALKHADWDIFPECIRWGITAGTKHLLLAGFQKWAEEDFSVTRQGQVCLWDVQAETEIQIRPHASSVYAAAWHPLENIFATGGAPGGGPLSYPGVTKSVVRLYDPRSASSYKVEFECPALDIQDVTFHPTNSNYVTASCTDGSTYVWDYRWPDQRIHRLDHGDPLQEMAANEDELPYYEHLERVDAGVMLSIWGKGATLFYTGSSDGVIKAWDILRSPEDVWVRDVAHLPAGVQSGALSSDGMNMLVGDAVGGIHVLSAAPFDMSSNEESDDHSDPINFIAAAETTPQHIDDPGTEGIYTANWLLKNGEMIIHPLFGAGKGQNYQGPLAADARWNNSETGYCELLPEYDRRQAFPINGDEQSKQATEIKALIAARKEQMSATRQGNQPFVISLGPPTPFVANRRPLAIKPRNAQTPNPSSLSQTLKQEPSTSTPSSQNLPKSHSQISSSLTTSAVPPPFIDIDELDSTTTSSPPDKKRKRRLSATSQSPEPPNYHHHHSAKRVKPMADHHHFSPEPIAIHPIRIDSIDIIPEIVDLVSDDDGFSTLQESTAEDTRTRWGGISEEDGIGKQGKMSVVVGRDGVATVEVEKEDEEEEGEEEENLLSYEEWIEEDYWWPGGC
ncbi:MAG: hypothetical protein Q9220_003017 [cf. Caloplaca sp. 1 TL-2023]